MAGPSGLRHGSLGSDRVSESEPESEPGLEGESENSESEGEEEQTQLQPAENEIEGDFEYVCSLRWLLIVPTLNGPPRSSNTAASSIQLKNPTVNKQVGCSAKLGI